MWEQRFSELKEKYTNPFEKKQLEDLQKEREKKLQQTINTYGNKFSFVDYLKMKGQDDAIIDMETTNPRIDFKDKKDNSRNDDSIIKAQVPRKRRKLKELTPEDLAIPKKVRDKLDEKKKRQEIIKNATGDVEAKKDSNKNEEYVPKLSPWRQEEIYRLYLEGWNVKDLSYKFGILPERVKAVAWMRHQFWKVEYPKIGESGLRERLKKCEEYALKVGYVDYGIDLEIMAEREQGKKIHQLSRSELDIRPTKEAETKVANTIGKLQGKAIDHVPIGFIGKGPKGYLIKELVVRRGIGSKRVSKMFQKFMHNKDLNDHLLPWKVVQKKELGPRLATMGYRF
jgi:hypothetical protein